MRLWQAVPILVLMPFCVGSASGSQDRNATVFVPAFSCSDASLGVKLPLDLPGLLQIGRIQRDAMDWIEKRNGYEVTHKYLILDGLVLGISTFSQAPTRYSVTFVEISDRRWGHLSAFKVGAEVRVARELLGVDASVDKDFVATYVGGRDGIEFTTANGELRRVVYKCAEDQPEQWK